MIRITRIRSWPWLVARCQQWQAFIIQKAQRENVRWPTRLRNIVLDGLSIREIGNLHELFASASMMRNCLASWDDDCVAGQARFFSVEQPGKKRPVALVGLVRKGEQWVVEDVRGFANAVVDESLHQIGQDIATRYQWLDSIHTKPRRQPALRIAEL